MSYRQCHKLSGATLACLKITFFSVGRLADGFGRMSTTPRFAQAPDGMLHPVTGVAGARAPGSSFPEGAPRASDGSPRVLGVPRPSSGRGPYGYAEIARQKKCSSPTRCPATQVECVLGQGCSRDEERAVGWAGLPSVVRGQSAPEDGWGLVSSG